MRVYVPATVTSLRELLETGELRATGDTAFALTPALRESYVAGTEEELEYAALLEAARASLRLISAEEGGYARRAVVSADVQGVTPRPDLDSAVVRLAGPVAMREVAAVHLDTGDAEEAVRAAAKVIDAADLGDEDAEFTLGDAEDHELSWYAAQELPFVLELL